jgi:hypothetical protein
LKLSSNAPGSLARPGYRPSFSTPWPAKLPLSLAQLLAKDISELRDAGVHGIEQNIVPTQLAGQMGRIMA